MTEKIVIIGAGLAGLSTGCCLQDNGYATEILEAHTLPGGGVPLTYKSGRDLAQIICRRDGRKFRRK